MSFFFSHSPQFGPWSFHSYVFSFPFRAPHPGQLLSGSQPSLWLKSQRTGNWTCTPTPPSAHTHACTHTHAYKHIHAQVVSFSRCKPPSCLYAPALGHLLEKQKGFKKLLGGKQNKIYTFTLQTPTFLFSLALSPFWKRKCITQNGSRVHSMFQGMIGLQASLFTYPKGHVSCICTDVYICPQIP